MSVITSGSTLMRQVERHVPTGAAHDRSLTNFDRHGWDNAVNRLLLWWQDPARAGDDDGFVPPSRVAVDVAIQVATALRDNRRPPPLRVIPDGEGGVAFERRGGHIFESLRVAADGEKELLVFENSRLVLREPQ